MTRAWNTGIFQYSVGKYKEAEHWCGLGMHFLNHLRSLKSSYESQRTVGGSIPQMIGLYSEVLDKLDRAKGLLPNEE
ncbi:integrin beta-1-binding protein 2 [Platysternon megacephalum]|uniref:Integrin beta-1-binding protein 2 n=1 Tax=Platysternon megacephalum TaxID=55544 RepID=A0A4D9EVC0_9SAUR|nr:integrin beta-1-binding protein 2 [Platysternon megacephalum]